MQLDINKNNQMIWEIPSCHINLLEILWRKMNSLLFKYGFMYNTALKSGGGVLNGPNKIFQTCKNITLTLRVGAVIKRVNIRHIKPYKTEDSE